MEILYYFDPLYVGLLCKIFKSNIDVFENKFFFFCNSYYHQCVSNITSISPVYKPNERFLAMRIEKVLLFYYGIYFQILSKTIKKIPRNEMHQGILQSTNHLNGQTFKNGPAALKALG